MSLVKDLISPELYGVKSPYTMTPKGIAVHNTANDAPAKNEVAYMKRNNSFVSFHIAIDDIEAIQCIPFNRNAYHAGDGSTGDGNRNYIAVEICYSLSGGEKFTKAEIRASKEIALILKQYNWTVKNIKKHQDFSGKYCPHRTLDLGWTRFLNMVQKELDILNKPVKPVEEVKKVDNIIIQYSNAVDQNIAETMADRLNCPTINCLRPYAHYGKYDIVISVGEGKNRSGHTNVVIEGKDRQETLDRAIEYCKKLGK